MTSRSPQKSQFGKKCLFLLGFLAGCFPLALTAQRMEFQAIIGRPFGVAVITLPTQDAVFGSSIREADGRVHYPVVANGAWQRLLAGEQQSAAGPKTAYFLFQGDAPLQLTLSGTAPSAVVLQPESQPERNHSRLLQRWWREYCQAAESVTNRGDYPPLVHDYLTGMLSQRLNLRIPLVSQLRQGSSSDLQRLADQLFGTERMHQAVLRESMAVRTTEPHANQPIPAEIVWQSPQADIDSSVPIEPMAQVVPEECFYVRFGSFENYLWLEELTNSYGGDLSRMITARGQNDQASDRLRTQLALPQSALAKLVGGRLIADVALIGRDLYVKEGAAIAVLFQARSGTLLSVSINQQRNLTLAAERRSGASLQTVQLNGRDVSLLSTPDNRVRSFYAVDGDFHLVATSSHVVERFFEAAEGKRCLAKLPEFQRARVACPVDRNDTVFAYLSTPFLAGLFSPQYQIELVRRTQALVNLELAQLATLAADGEHLMADDMEHLIANGFLPQGYGRQADGSGPIVETDRVIDSLRGAHGSFLPIPDVEIRRVTAAESSRYQTLADNFFQPWRQLDPVRCSIHRETLDGDRESLTIDADISPLSQEKYGQILALLGPPVTQRVVPRDGDLISVQAFVTGGQNSTVIPPHLLFAGVQDLRSPVDLNGNGILQWLRVLQSTPGYLGAWPKPGFLDWLPLRANPAGPDGLSRLLFDAWRWQGDGFSVISFQRDVLDAVTPQLVIAESDDPAQIRVQVNDLAQSQFRGWINAVYYERAWNTSLANAKMLDVLTQQLGVPTSAARATAERLLGTQLVCPLGGTYEITELTAGRSVWRSTAWPTSGPNRLPEDYTAPLLEWFRGLHASLAKLDDQVNVRVRLDLQR